ncbi:MAG: BlaI/MecI/CopY family transcriptional regulator [Bacteroidales bacterium]
MKELTKAEEQVMQNLWKLEKGFLKDIVEAFPEPRPAYTTLSTVIRVLVKKGYIGYHSYGKTHEYFPKVKKGEYFRKHVNNMISDHFGGSVVDFASFFTGNEEVDLTELEEIRSLIDQKIRKIRKEEE